jgi:lipopolysaccharide/colanic/teichoic acid biosynthesis glycosyltransferase
MPIGDTSAGYVPTESFPIHGSTNEKQRRLKTGIQMQIRERMEPAAILMTKRNIRNSVRRTADSLDHEELFHRLLTLERKRSDRTGEPFLLVLIHCEALIRRGAEPSIGEIGIALAASVRVTDVTGWHRNRSTIGLIFTSFNGAGRTEVRSAISSKIQRILGESLHASEVGHVEVSFHFYPQDGESGQVGTNEGPFPGSEDLAGDFSLKSFAIVKRSIDILGSLSALLMLSPAFLVISALIKMTSAGPVFFRQQRLGKSGVTFTFLKFRSMVVANDSGIHREFSRNLIRGNVDSPAGIYKIQKDPRVTPLGRILRATSLDELPQFINVLIGTMSLVGPRPPIPYEYECYQPWHRRRILEAKPGITGKWQIHGRSRTTFDDMVRMDLQYIRERSIWGDILILLRTPFAVIGGHGAY